MARATLPSADEPDPRVAAPTVAPTAVSPNRTVWVASIAAGLILVVAATLAVTVKATLWSPLEPMQDLGVYREAAHAVLDGRPLYEAAGDRLVFTYPPFAALVSVLLTPLGDRAADIVWALVLAAVYAALVRAAFTRALARVDAGWRPLALGGLTAALILTQVMTENLIYGQVNIVLAALVVADLLVDHPRWPRGALIGIAAALKLTPLIFVAYLLVTRRWRAAGVAVTTAVGCTALAWLVVPSASSTFWTSALFDTTRVGDVAHAGNQSLLGVLDRVLPAVAARPLWLLGAAAIGAFGLWRAAEAHRRNNELAAIAVVGLVSVLVSPISWIHHLVWVTFALGVLAGDLRSKARVAVAVAVTLVLTQRLPWAGATIEAENRPGPALGALAQLLQSSYAFLVVGLVVCLPIDDLRSDPEPSVSTRRATGSSPAS